MLMCQNCGTAVAGRLEKRAGEAEGTDCIHGMEVRGGLGGGQVTLKLIGLRRVLVTGALNGSEELPGRTVGHQKDCADVSRGTANMKLLKSLESICRAVVGLFLSRGSARLTSTY